MFNSLGSRADGGILLASLLALALSFFPWGTYFLYPFKLFTTWVHECGHAVAATLMGFLVGGGVDRLTIHYDTSGLAHYALGSSSRLIRALVASSGYMGASLVGCLLLWAARTSVPARWVFWSLGAMMVLSVLFWVRNFFGVVAVLLMAASLIGISGGLSGGYSGRINTKWLQFGLQFLAVQTALQALFDIRVLFGLSSSTASDAKTLEEVFFLPAPVWALTWIGLSVAAFYWTWQWSAPRR